MKRTAILISGLAFFALLAGPATAQDTEIAIIDSCLGVDHSPPYTHPGTGAAINTPSIILWGAALDGAPVDAEFAVLMAPPGGGSVMDDGRMNGKGRVGGAFGIDSFGDYEGVEITIVFDDPTTGEERSVTIDPSSLFIGGVFTVGPQEVACDVGGLKKGTLLTADEGDSGAETPAPEETETPASQETPPDQGEGSDEGDEALASDEGGGGSTPWILVTVVGGILVVLGGGMKVRGIRVKGPAAPIPFGHPGSTDDYVCPGMWEDSVYPEDPPRPNLRF